MNPAVKSAEVLGEPVYKTLADVPGEIDVVLVFRAPEFAPEVAREAVARGAKTFWLQEGIVSLEAAQIAQDAGLGTVMNRCIYKEAQRLRGHLPAFRPSEGLEAVATD